MAGLGAYSSTYTFSFSSATTSVTTFLTLFPFFLENFLFFVLFTFFAFFGLAALDLGLGVNPSGLISVAKFLTSCDVPYTPVNLLRLTFLFLYFVTFLVLLLKFPLSYTNYSSTFSIPPKLTVLQKLLFQVITRPSAPPLQKYSPHFENFTEWHDPL